MFWDKGYAPSQNIEALLEKENVTVEEFLDDEDILQECKSQKKLLVNYFTRPDVVKRLVELITTQPSEELPMAVRFRHANMACEILTLGLPSLDEKILSDADTLKMLYSYLENEPPLNPLLSSFFSKTFSMLFTKKPNQDWFLYQQMCLQILEYIKSQKNFLDLVCKHFSTPVIPDLIMQMMKDVEGGALKRNLYEWLTKERLVERLINILGNPEENEKHSNVAEFLCDLIQQGRTMRQNDSENDSFEPTFNGSNPILQVIESQVTIDALINVILEPNAQESAIISGITVVLTLLKPVVFIDEPNSDRLKLLQSREKDVHEQILKTVISVIAPRLKDFNELLRNPPNKPEIVTTAAKLSPPFGMVRLQICRVFTELLQTRNEQISKAICETDFFEVLLKLFKEYCWNNFLHSEVEKCLHLVFYTNLSNNNSLQGSTIVNDGSFNKNNSGDNNLSMLIFGDGNGDNNDVNNVGVDANGDVAAAAVNEESNNGAVAAAASEEGSNGDVAAIEESNNKVDNESATNTDKTDKDDNEGVNNQTVNNENNDIQQLTTEMNGLGIEERKEEEKKTEADKDSSGDETTNGADATAVPSVTGPSALQTHVIAQCKIVSKLIDCWQHNREMQSAEKGRRLGYMGHLINIFKHITACISEFQHIGALIESNLSDAAELELWKSITNPTDGEFTQALATQNKMLNWNAHEATDYTEFLPDNSSEFINDLVKSSGIDWTSCDRVSLEGDRKLLMNVFLAMDQEWKKASTSALNTFGVTSNPWDTMDPFEVLTTTSIDNMASTPWTTDFPTDNFADFDSHFSSFTNDLGDSLSGVGLTKGIDDDEDDSNIENSTPNTFGTTNANIIGNSGGGFSSAAYDNNANVEKMDGDFEKFAKFEDDENAKNELVAAAAGRLVLHDSDEDDDYEDDDGIWTKPVGERAAELEAEAGSKTVPSEVKSTTLISNGPSKQQLPIGADISEQIHYSNDITETPTNDAASTPPSSLPPPPLSSAADIKNKFLNATADHPLEINLDAATAAADAKVKSSLLAVNNVEIAPTS